ncbi:MAG TPA: glycosyltransferase [Firmicutes bacterium]|nr:glycosyltransferase [Bacillota bacterium]
MRLGIISDYDFFTGGDGRIYVNRGQDLLESICGKFDEVVYFGRLHSTCDVSSLLPVRATNFRVVALRSTKRNPVSDAVSIAKRVFAHGRDCDLFLVKLGNLHALVGFLLVRVLGKPIACYAINDLDLSWCRHLGLSIWRQGGYKVLHYVWRLLYVLADGRLAISPRVAKRYCLGGWGGDADIYVEASVSVDRCLAFEAVNNAGDDLVILSVGRLVSYKGHAVLVEAVAKLVHSHKLAVRLVVVGDGPERDYLEGLATKKGLSNSVTFTGYVPQGEQLWSIYSRASVYVQPSLTESFGMAVLEAMCFGLPVVASAVGGLQDLVVHGVTGFLVPPGDVDALEIRLGTLLASPGLRSKLGEAAKVFASRYKVEGETEKLGEAMRRLQEKRVAGN